MLERYFQIERDNFGSPPLEVHAVFYYFRISASFAVYKSIVEDDSNVIRALFDVNDDWVLEDNMGVAGVNMSTMKRRVHDLQDSGRKLRDLFWQSRCLGSGY